MTNLVSVPQATSSAMPASATEQVDLEDRIAAAFSDGAETGAVAKLIGETERAALRAEVRADVYRKHALDPALAGAEVAWARKQMEDAEFRSARLKVALQKLKDRLRELREQEEDQRRLAIYMKVKEERDDLASELAEIYPPLVTRLADLLRRIEANNKQVDIVNRSLPRDSGPLRLAELTARGLPMFKEWLRRNFKHRLARAAPDV